MGEKYIVGDIDNNVKVALNKLKEAYFSKNCSVELAKQFTEAESMIVSAICYHGYTVKKEGDDK